MAAKIDRIPLHELRPGEQADFFALLCERVRRSTRDGKPFYGLKFRDLKRTASVPVWENSAIFEPCDKVWKVGDHFKIRGVLQNHDRYGPQIEIHNIRKVTAEDWVDGYDPASLVPTTRFDVEALYEELTSSALSIGDEPLRRLVVSLLEKHADDIKRYPGASRHHHSFRGGYLEHTVSVVRTGMYLADKYGDMYTEMSPPLNRDLIVAGCILHDIGKLRELDPSNEPTIYTVEGNLIGHILMGRDMVRDAAREIPELSAELLLYLDHVITSHQGTPEWGSPRPPMIAEALLVHFADDLDAKMNMFAEATTTSEAEGPFTDMHYALKRKLLRDRTV